jgi:hypothetical protein
VRVVPDTNAVNVARKSVEFVFDETINDRGTGAQGLEGYFFVSPSDGEPRVSWHRGRIEVRPRHGFRPNTAYTVTLLPGLTDLRNNAMKRGASVVFSTGPTIPPNRLTGVAFDWVAERPAANALLEAITPDSVRYLAQADSAGRFSLGPLPEGRYVVRATIDQNHNHALDRGEAWDTVAVTAPDTSALELLAATRDTLPARLESVALVDSVTLRLTFDRLLDPAQTFSPDSFAVVGADSAAIRVSAVRTPREDAELQQQRMRQAADSVRRADSLAGRPRAAAAPPPTSPPSAVPLPARRAAPADTAAAKPSRPPPFTTVTAVVTKPLAPATSYRARARSVRALSGRSATSERLFSTPRTAPPAAATDSTRAPAGAPIPRRP